MLDALKEEVLEANLRLVREGLVVLTWGNASARDPGTGLVVIKPSGVDSARLKVEDMVVLDLNGTVVEGVCRPSSDTPTHLELYRAFPEVGGVVHTHSAEATARAQSRREIPCYGMTHAGWFNGPVPLARSLTEEEVAADYELNTGKVIVEGFEGKAPMAQPGCLVRNHGPFAWGKNAAAAVYHAVVVEEVAKMSRDAELLCVAAGRAIDDTKAPQYLLDKHYMRKHGPNAYYGQR